MYALIDIGGTKTRVAASEDLERFGEPVILDTAADYTEGIGTLIETIRKVTAGAAIEAVSIGIPGSIATDRRSTYNRKNLAKWSGQPIVADVGQATGASVILENDTALVGLGEAVYGAGAGAAIVAYLTVSTGVNGVRIVDGRIDRSAMGFEIGGQYVPMSVETTFENLISGRSIEEKYGKHPKDMGKDWEGWDELSRITAFGVHNTMLHWSPDRFVLGGSMFNEVGISVPKVVEYVKQIMQKFPLIPDVVHSGLGDVGGLWGGLARLKQLRP